MPTPIAAKHDADAVVERETSAEYGPAPFGETGFEEIHRATGDRAVRILAPKFHAERALGEFRRHAEKARDDKPEGGACAADGDGDGDVGDVADADGSGDGRRERLEMRDIPGLVAIVFEATDDAQGMSEATDVDATEEDCEEARTGDQPNYDQRNRHTEDWRLEHNDPVGDVGDGSEGLIDLLVNGESGGGRRAGHGISFSSPRAGARALNRVRDGRSRGRQDLSGAASHGPAVRGPRFRYQTRFRMLA